MPRFAKGSPVFVRTSTEPWFWTPAKVLNYLPAFAGSPAYYAVTGSTEDADSATVWLDWVTRKDIKPRATAKARRAR